MTRTVLVVVVLGLLWWLAALGIDRSILPPPPRVVAEMIAQIAAGSLHEHLLVSLYRVVTALLCAFVPAFILGIGAGLHRRIDEAVSPVAYVLFPIPKVALLPIILLFLGLGDLSKIFLVAIIVFFHFYLAIRDETALIDRHYFDSLYTLGGSRSDLLIHVVVPAVLPRIFSAVRMSLGTALAVLFLVETFATRRGIGWYIMDAWTRLAYTEMYAGILALSVTGLILFAAIDVLQRALCRWK